MPVSAEEKPTARSIQVAGDQAFFRNFSAGNFRETESWLRVSVLLDGDGGSFAIYGPRGSGKTWLMLMAINSMMRQGGLGLWISCAREYHADDFLTELSDNLARAIEQRFAKSRTIISAVEGVGRILAALLLGALLSGVILAGVRVSTGTHGSALASVYPAWVWFVIVAAGFLAAAALVVSILYQGDVPREASALRERIRFSESLKVGANLGLSGGRPIVASLSRSRERTLQERPAQTATLTFDLRHLAERAARKLPKPLVICIDELDKANDPTHVAALLRDIRIICEIPRTCVFISISEATAATLQSGMLKVGVQNELSNSFYSLIALGALDPEGAMELLHSRDLGTSGRLPTMLCLLAGGNQRELVRMADLCAMYSRRNNISLDEYVVIDLLAEESFALLQEIIRDLPEMNLASADEDVKYRSWMALQREAFTTPDRFIRLGSSAIREFWEPTWVSADWVRVREPWRRLLIRLFIAAKLLPPTADRDAPCLLDDKVAAIHLRDILVMATRDSGVARLMLLSCFGADLSEHYRQIPQRRSRMS